MAYKDPEKKKAYGREYMRKQREINPTSVAQYQRDWARKNPEAVLAKTAKWKENHPEHQIRATELRRKRMETDPEYAERKRAQACAAQKRLREREPERVWSTALKSKYGITAEQYNSMLVAQNYGCRICGRPEHDARSKRLAVDHCAVTGKVRGLLCGNCNNGVGRFQHDVALIERAMKYLQETV